MNSTNFQDPIDHAILEIAAEANLAAAMEADANNSATEPVSPFATLVSVLAARCAAFKSVIIDGDVKKTAEFSYKYGSQFEVSVLINERNMYHERFTDLNNGKVKTFFDKVVDAKTATLSTIEAVDSLDLLPIQ